MARYMVQGSYTQQGISDLVKNPQDRSAHLQSLVEGMGGRISSIDYAFGDHDVVVIAELPDNVAMTALSMAVGASGAISGFKTTVLIPMDEAVEAMRRAGSIGYRPPGG